ncbi:Sin-like protein conserved region-domain-containing protein [Xylariaceae sp. FL0255]|nr:Sin-like protein conserved region-domain-containing protein [Xylariaceae sp. FL0255]
MDIDNPATDSSAAADIDNDPIIASYKVYANPSLASNRQLLIMQYPNKQGHLNSPYAHVSEVRLKPRSQMIEVDVPISHAHADYDRDKGQRWGSALSRSMAAKNGGSHGLAGGFGVGVSAMRPSKRRDELERGDDLLDWNEAVRQDKVLRTQTLGGQLPNTSETECQYMVGVFKGNQLHLTPATALIQLRPQLHHIDATAEQERTSRRLDSAAAGGAGGPGTGAAGSKDAPARAIHMSIKSADASGGSGELTTETMADRLRGVQTEAWRKLRFEDDESPRSWDVFSNNLMYRAGGGANKANANEDGSSNPKIGISGDDGKDKGKEKEVPQVIDIDSSSSSDTEQLHAQWNADDFLKAVSALPDGPEGSAQRKQAEGVEIKKEDMQPESGAGKAAATAKGRGKASAPSAPPAAVKKTPNTKGKSVAFKGQPMELD